MTGEVLGANGTPVPVETVELSSSKPGFFGKLFGRKPKKAVVYVCCSACAARVRQDPRLYQGKVEEARRATQRERDERVRHPQFSAGGVAR